MINALWLVVWHRIIHTNHGMYCRRLAGWLFFWLPAWGIVLFNLTVSFMASKTSTHTTQHQHDTNTPEGHEERPVCCSAPVLCSTAALAPRTRESPSCKVRPPVLPADAIICLSVCPSDCCRSCNGAFRVDSGGGVCLLAVLHLHRIDGMLQMPRAVRHVKALLVCVSLLAMWSLYCRCVLSKIAASARRRINEQVTRQPTDTEGIARHGWPYLCVPALCVRHQIDKIWEEVVKSVEVHLGEKRTDASSPRGRGIVDDEQEVWCMCCAPPKKPDKEKSRSHGEMHPTHHMVACKWSMCPSFVRRGQVGSCQGSRQDGWRRLGVQARQDRQEPSRIQMGGTDVTNNHPIHNTHMHPLPSGYVCVCVVRCRPRLSPPRYPRCCSHPTRPRVPSPPPTTSVRWSWPRCWCPSRPRATAPRGKTTD